MEDTETLVPHEPDHVVTTQHGGETALESLAYACFQYNCLKGPNLASLDPTTGAVIPLFNPRAERWSPHVELTEALVVPLTALGRATAFLLPLDDPERVTIRANLLNRGRDTPPHS